MKCLILLALLFFCNAIYAIDLNLPMSAIHNASNNLNLIYRTPASMSMQPAIFEAGIETSATYLFGMDELPKYNLHFVIPFKYFHFHFGNSYLDHEFYSENNAILGVSYLWNSICAGINARMLSCEVSEYQSANTTLIDGGISWQQGAFSSAIAVHNLNQGSFYNVSLPIVYLWESCYQFSGKSFVSLGLEKEDEFDFSFKLAGRYDLFKMLTIITSYQFEPNRLGVGTAFQFDHFRVIYSVRTHQYLGLTHYISIGYEVFN